MGYKTIKRILCLILICLIPFNLTACMGVKAQNLMKGITPDRVQGRPVDGRFIDRYSELGIELFKKSYKRDENSLISPLSVMLALAMTANGADNETLGQMEQVLGGGMAVDKLNEYLYSFVGSLPSEKKAKFEIANSVWFRDDSTFTVGKDFLQKNADYYGADAYKSAFDDRTVEDINNWVKDNTDGMIEEIVDSIDSEDIMFLINAVVFDAQWKEIYHKEDISEGEFESPEGRRAVEFMKSEEFGYIDDGKATGFIKPYANGYSFAALLPNEGVSIDEYIGGIEGGRLLEAVKKSKEEPVVAYIPKFSFDYSVEMNGILESLGITDAFSPEDADFGRLGKSSKGNIYISQVLHKTHITVDERGTRAGAVTKVEMEITSALDDPKIVKLDRPFVYAIIEDQTKLPVFIGTVVEP